MFHNFLGNRGDGESQERNNQLAEIGGATINKSSKDAALDIENGVVDFIVVYNKQKYDVRFNSNRTVKELKMYLQGLIGVPESLQKVMFRGLAKDEQTLKNLDVKNGAKVMVVGSKLDQIMAVTTSSSQVKYYLLLSEKYDHFSINVCSSSRIVSTNSSFSLFP